MEKKEYTVEELRNFAFDINNEVYFHDLWKMKDYFMNVPEEDVDPIGILPSQILIKIMSGQLEQAHELTEKILTYETPHKDLVYHSVSLVLPDLSLQEMEQHVESLRKIGRTVRGLTYTASRPTVLNGHRDFSSFGSFLYKEKDRFLNLLKIMYPDCAEEMYEIGKAEYFYQTNQCIKSMARISNLIPHLEATGNTKLMFVASCLQMNLLVANGEVKSASDLVKQIRLRVESTGSSEFLYNMDALETKIAIYEGNYEVVENWLNNKAPNEYSDFNMYDLYRYMVKFRCYILTGKFISALALVSRLRPLLAKGLRYMDLCELELLIAIGAYKANLMDECLKAMERAVELAIKYHYLRIFADEGQPMLKVLHAYKKSKPKKEHIDFINKIIEITRNTALLYPNYLLEPMAKKIELTLHEIDILKLLSHGLTYEEIAGQSNISINTVRYHIKKIYEKMNVNSAQEALSRARTMDII